MVEGFPEYLVEGVPAHGGGWNKMAFKVSSHKNHSVISEKQNPLEYPSTNSLQSKMACIHQEGHFPWGWTRGEGKRFSAPGRWEK